MNTIHTALITGANSGLGFEAAAQLAEQGASRVILGCRNPEKAATAQRELQTRTGRDVFEVKIIDVSDVTSSANAAKQLSESGVQIDLLLLNASKDSLDRVITKGGFELTLATNLVGHHVLTMELINGGALSEDARIVISTSETVRRMAKDRIFDYKRLAQQSGSVSAAARAILRGELPQKHTQPSSYGNAKLWAIWWASELAMRLPKGMAIFAVSPGVIPETRAPSTLPWALRTFVFPLYRWLGPKIGQAWSVSEGAQQYLVAVGFPPEHSGTFYGAPPGRVIGKLERQTDSFYDNPPWSSAVWGTMVQETGYTLHSCEIVEE